ncbi:MAG: putative molybdenum carrier protein [Desulfocapsaceae bacterium]|nr:putative molybdenum carrier protein [Desulfocapsaceae bacterium]
MIKKIISGGQTGVDQAALDAAITCGIEHGGWLPAGRMTEDGPLPVKYQLQELPGSSYPERTRKNVVVADATLIVSRGKLSGGSALTATIASELDKAWLHIDLAKQAKADAVVNIKSWLQNCEPDVLNVAGPRASSDREIYGDVYQLIEEILQAQQEIEG